MEKVTKLTLFGIGVGAGIACGALLQRAMSKKLLCLAMSREAPKNLDKRKRMVSGSCEFLDVIDGMKAQSDKFEASGLEDVEITSRDRLRLKGHYYENKNAKRVIVAMHGWRSSWCRDFCGIADFWHENGCSVLYAEQRGQNGSEGEYIGFGISERYDCLEWARFISERTSGELPIYLAGVSMGATTVLMTSSLSLPESVCGIIADCGFTSPREIWRHVLRNNLKIPYGIVSRRIDASYKRITEEKSNFSCEDALRRCKVPVLFVHGTADKFVPVEMTYKNYMACASEKTLMIVPGADHGMSYIKEKEKYERTVLDFWEKNDERAGGLRGKEGE